MQTIIRWLNGISWTDAGRALGLALSLLLVLVFAVLAALDRPVNLELVDALFLYVAGLLGISVAGFAAKRATFKVEATTTSAAPEEPPA